jgi:hypothetical protein
MQPIGPTTVPQPLPGMMDPQIDLASIADPWEQRVVAISLVAGMRAAQRPPRQLLPALPPVEGVAPFTRDLPSPDEFRREHLPEGVVLAPHQVDGWIREQALRDGLASWRFMGVWVQPEEIERQDSDGVVLAPGTKLHFDPEPGSTGADVMGTMMLEYATPLSASRRQPVRGGGVLDTLRRLSHFYQHLAWEWIAAQGTTFVLTGLVPYAAKWAEHVAIQAGRRPRPMSTKHLTLAVFTERYSRSREGLAQRIAHWNELHPSWSYTNVDQFSSDSARALRRMGRLS